MAAGVSPDVGRRLVGDADGRVISRNLTIINGFGAEMSAARASALGSDPRVRAVSLNGSVEPRLGRLGPMRENDEDDDRGDSRYDFLAAAFAQRPRVYDSLPAGCAASRGTTVSLAGWPLRKKDNLSRPKDALRRLSGVQHASVGADRVWPRVTGNGVGVAVIDTGIAGDLPDFRRAADRRESRVVASAVTNPCATRGHRQLRPRHARGRPDRGQQPRPAERRPALRPQHGHRASRQPDLGEGFRRERSKQRAGRDLRPAVRGGPQGQSSTSA